MPVGVGRKIEDTIGDDNIGRDIRGSRDECMEEASRENQRADMRSDEGAETGISGAKRNGHT